MAAAIKAVAKVSSNPRVADAIGKTRQELQKLPQLPKPPTTPTPPKPSQPSQTPTVPPKPSQLSTTPPKPPKPPSQSTPESGLPNKDGSKENKKGESDDKKQDDGESGSDQPGFFQKAKGQFNQLIGNTPEQKLQKNEKQRQNIADKIALKSAISGMSNRDQVSVKDSNNPNDTSVIEIVKTTGIVLEIFFNLVPMIVYFIALYILAMAYINLILYIFSILYYFFRTNDSTIIYDTLRYKLLGYARIIKEYSNIDEKGIDGYDSFSSEIGKNIDGQCPMTSNQTPEESNADKTKDTEEPKQYTPEPVFFLFNVNFAIVLINIIYALLLAVFIVCLLVVLFMKVVVPLFNRNFKTDSFTDKEGHNVFTSVATNFYTYVGLILGIILYFIYRMYFRDFMYAKLNNVQYEIDELDRFIFEALSEGGSTIDKNLRLIMDDKKKGNSNGQYTDVNDIILQYLSSGNINKATQGLLYFTLYSNLHDNIPDSNRSAIDKINKYFFQNKDDFDTALTYVSLNMNSNGVTEVRKIYMELEIFANKSAYPDQVGNIEALLSKIECKVDELNKKITELPELKNMSIFFGIFIVMLFIFCVLFMMSYNLIVIQDEQRKNKNSLSFIAESINKLLIAQFPQLGAYYLSLIYREQSALCSGQANDSSSVYYNSFSKCMSESVKTVKR